MDTFLDLRAVRYGLGALCLVVFLVSGYTAVQALLMRHRLQHDLLNYYNAPNCYNNAPAGATPVDRSLPSCTEVQETVVDKPVQTPRHTYEPLLYLTLREPGGSLWTVGPFLKKMWTEINIGDRVTAQVWRGVIYKVRYSDGAAQGEQDISDDQSGSTVARYEAVWDILAVVSFALLCRLATARHVLDPE